MRQFMYRNHLVGLGQGGLYGTGVSSTDVGNALTGACTNVTGTNCQGYVNTAVSAYQQLGPTAVNVVANLAHGNIGGAMNEVAPLIGAAAGGLIGGPLGAAAGAAIASGLEAIFSALFPPPPPPPVVACNYTLWPAVWIHNASDSFCQFSQTNVAFGGFGADYGSQSTSAYMGGGTKICGPVPTTQVQVGTCFHNSISPPGPLIPPQGTTPATPDPRWLTIEAFCSGGGTSLGGTHASWQNINTSYNPQTDASLNSDNSQALCWADIAFAPWFGTPTIWQNTKTQNAMPYSATLRGSLAVGDPLIPVTNWVPFSGQAFQPPPPGSLVGYGLPIGNGAGNSAIGAPQLTNVTPQDVIAKQGFQKMLQSGGSGLPANVLSQNIATFVQVYAKALLRGMCEAMINNRSGGTDPDTGQTVSWAAYPNILLQAVQQAWNANYDNSSTYTFGLDNDIVSIVDAVIQGQIIIPGQGGNTSPQQSQSADPITINIGNFINQGMTTVHNAHLSGMIPVKFGALSPKGTLTPTSTAASAGMSTGETWALWTAGIAAAITGGLYLYAHTHHTTMGAVVKSMGNKVKATFHHSSTAIPRYRRR